MTSPLLVVFTLAAFVATSTTGKDAGKNSGKDSVKNANVDLAAELQKARQDAANAHQESAKARQDAANAREESAKLRQDLEKAREETKAIITRENTKLREDAEKLKEEDEKIKREADKIRKANEKLHRQDEELKRKIHALHKADSAIKSSLRQVSRQRDQNETMEMRNILKNSFRQTDYMEELKNTINVQIQEYLDDNKICEGGEIRQVMNKEGNIKKTPKIKFGHTFRRIPTFLAAISSYDIWAKDSGNKNPYIYLVNYNITTTSAAFTISGRYVEVVTLSWIACL